MTQDQERILKEVHDAIVGNKTGNKGIIPRLEDLEKYRESDKKIKWGMAGGLATLNFIWHALTK